MTDLGLKQSTFEQNERLPLEFVDQLAEGYSCSC